MGLYLKHGHYGPQEGVEVFTVATGRLVAGFATKFASEQIHAQNAVPIFCPGMEKEKKIQEKITNKQKKKKKQKNKKEEKEKRKKKKTLNINK